MAVAMVRVCGYYPVRFWRDDETEGLLRYYRVDLDAPCLPVPHCFQPQDQVDLSPAEELGDGQAGQGGKQAIYDGGQKPRWGPGDDFCGEPEAWMAGGRRGVDPPLVWTLAGLSTCCMDHHPEGLMGLTANIVPVATGAGMEIVDSTINADPTAPCVDVGKALCATYLTLPRSDPPPDPPAGKLSIYIASDGTPIVVEEDGTAHPLVSGIPASGLDEGRIPRAGTGGGILVPSRIVDPGTGGVIVQAPLAPWSIQLYPTSGAGPFATISLTNDLTMSTYQVSVNPPAGSPYTSGRLQVIADETDVTVNAYSTGGTGGNVAFSVEGSRGTTDSANGLAVKGGIVTAVPTSDDLRAAVVPAGMLMPFAGTGTPAGRWLLCDGSAVSRTTYASLFAAIGTTYGPGDGSTTFNLPDPRGRALGVSGTGTGLTARAVGDQVGEEQHTLSAGELPAHKHQIGMRNDGAVVPGNIQIGTTGNTFAFDSTGTTGDAAGGGADGLSHDNAGGGAAHNNMQPSMFFPLFIAY